MINALPSSVACQLERLERTIAEWPVTVSMDHAVKWVLQFDSDDYPLALRIIENIDVLGPRQLRSTLEVAQAKLERAAIEKGSAIKGNNTLYAGVGNAAKSGAMIAYHYRIAADISENDFFALEEEDGIDFGKIDNIVLVDDVIGTGKSVSSDISKIVEEVHTLPRTRNIFVLTVAGYEDGIKRVVEETGASVICALEYSSKDTVTNLDAKFYDGMLMSERTRTLERIKRYCKIITRSELGYGGVGGLLVFDHNTPNTSLPVIWGRGSAWSPLFPRASRVVGAAKVLKVVENERSQQHVTDVPAQVQPVQEEAELTIFVEGKVDEIFVDFMRTRLNLATKLGVKEVNAVALGGLSHSSKLIGMLRESRKNAVFVVEGDTHSRRMAEKLLSNDPTLKILFLKPSFAAMLDISKLYRSVERFPGLPEAAEDAEDPRWLSALESALFRRAPISANTERLSQVIEEFLSVEKFDAFTAELRQLVDRMFRGEVESI